MDIKRLVRKKEIVSKGYGIYQQQSETPALAEARYEGSEVERMSARAPRKKSVKSAYIPYSRQTIGPDDIRAVVKVLKSAFITQGPAVPEFEDALARACGARYVVAFSSGTAALHAAYAAAGISRGNEVVTSPLTFAATANMVLAHSATPVFADIDTMTGNLDPAVVEKKITKKTKAIVVVDYAGLPADLGAFRTLAKKHKLILIEDAAHALGATYKGRSVGTQSDMTMFSFHPVKSITTGEGGAIATNSKAYCERLRMFRSHGLTKDPQKFKYTGFAAWHQEVQALGFNYRLTDIQAALGLSQIKKLDQFIAKRRVAARRYLELLADVPGIKLPPRSGLMNSAWHLFVVRVDARKRDRVFNAMRARGIGVQVHYLPVYRHPYYESLGYRAGLYPKAGAFSESAISIPLYPTITVQEQKKVVRALVAALAE